MRILMLLTAAALALPSPAPASPTVSQSQADTVAGELPAFGAWLGRANAIHEPVQADLGGLGERWQQLQSIGYRRGGAEFRAAVDRSLALIAQARAQAEAIDTPAFASLEMPDDIHPATIRRNMIRTYDELGVAIGQFIPLADAFGSGDAAAVTAAGRRLFASLRVVLDTQVLLRRASLGAIPPEEAAWEVTNIEYLYIRTMGRLFEGVEQKMEGRPDPSLSADLLALADEFEATAGRGSEKLEAQIAELGESADALEIVGDRAGLDVVRRAARVSAALRPAFPIARRVAALLRAGVGSDRSRPPSMADINALVGGLRSVRGELDAVTHEENAALAAPVR